MVNWLKVKPFLANVVVFNKLCSCLYTKKYIKVSKKDCITTWVFEKKYGTLLDKKITVL